MKNIKKHFAYYLSLFLILLFGFSLVVISSPNLRLQGVIIFLTIVFYVGWGILHHLINHELTLRIMIEYVLIGLLGIAILFFMFSGGAI